jgi:hypothetical protein
MRQLIRICVLLVCLAVGFVFSRGFAAGDVFHTQFSNLELDFASFPAVKNNWGMENISFFPNDSNSGKYMRVFIPKGAIDPGTMRLRGMPRGGAGFKSVVFPSGVKRAVLSYRVRFPIGFDFVKGGKLPGFFGGKGNSGGIIPDGTDGFSFRLMWGLGGRGNVYAYLPSSVRYGTGLLVHKFNFRTGVWHQIVQELILNDPGYSNGVFRLWMDGQFVGEESNVLVRTIGDLKINGMFFDVFFGGNDDSWAPPADTYIDFSDFSMRGEPY